MNFDRFRKRITGMPPVDSMLSLTKLDRGLNEMNKLPLNESKVWVRVQTVKWTFCDCKMNILSYASHTIDAVEEWQDITTQNSTKSTICSKIYALKGL